MTMASEVESRPWPFPPLDAWPPDDSEESVVGTDWHQMTIMNLRWGINEIARAHTPPGEAVPWQALSQTVVTGFARPDGSRYKTLPDVFVYRHPIDQHRGSLAVGLDGPPALIIEALSESTYDVDLDLLQGKGYSYAHAGVNEYLALDPTGAYAPEGGCAWRLENGVYQPWDRDAEGRWHSAHIDVAIGLEGARATVYTREGVRQPHEGEVGAELVETLTRGRVEGQRQALQVLLQARFGVLLEAVEQRIAAADEETLNVLIERAATVDSLDAL